LRHPSIYLVKFIWLKSQKILKTDIF